eukprot:1151022-Pelagomonas_calceolata.AAC.5
MRKDCVAVLSYKVNLADHGGFKMGVHLLHFQLSIHLHTQCNELVSCNKVVGQKLSSERSCIPALPGTQDWLQVHLL